MIPEIQKLLEKADHKAGPQPDGEIFWIDESSAFRYYYHEIERSMQCYQRLKKP